MVCSVSVVWSRYSLCPLTTDISVATHVQDHIDTQDYTDDRAVRL